MDMTVLVLLMLITGIAVLFTIEMYFIRWNRLKDFNESLFIGINCLFLDVFFFFIFLFIHHPSVFSFCVYLFFFYRLPRRLKTLMASLFLNHFPCSFIAFYSDFESSQAAAFCTDLRFDILEFSVNGFPYIAFFSFHQLRVFLILCQMNNFEIYRFMLRA